MINKHDTPSIRNIRPLLNKGVTTVVQSDLVRKLLPEIGCSSQTLQSKPYSHLLPGMAEGIRSRTAVTNNHEYQAPNMNRVAYSYSLYTDTRVRSLKLYKQSRPAVAIIIYHTP
jgi:hypothetical protein